MGSYTSTPPLPKLHAAAFTHPAIDNHAHPLLRSSSHSDLPFEGLISEASGAALTSDAPHTLAFHRAATQLASLFGVPQGRSSQETWDAIKAKRAELGYTELCKRCFEPTGIQSILIDDGLGVRDIVHEIPWHDQFTRSPTRRVVRIEVVAEEILAEIFASLSPSPSGEDIRHGVTLFLAKLQKSLDSSAAEAEVVAFKSVVAYRSGLAVHAAPAASGEEDWEELVAAFQQIHKRYIGSDKVRLQEKALNDRVVGTALQTSATYGKPVQFHTGVGDSDITLALSSPAHLQDVIKAYPDASFVLLHSSYPYTRDAGYLTATYSNVFLDFGEIFPIVSAQGQRAAIRQLLELAPTNKIMWSTDGHFFPESYYLGALQGRQALYDVLSETVQAGDITEAVAVEIAENALFHTANRVYKLGLQPTQAKGPDEDEDSETPNPTFDFL